MTEREDFPPRNHEWTITSAGAQSGVIVVAVCMRCGSIRLANVRESRSINLDGQCWRMRDGRG